MTAKRFLVVPAATLVVLLSWGNAQAFECPKHIAEAQTVIDKVSGDLKGTKSKKLTKEDRALVHTLLDDAKSRLSAAKHNHERPQWAFDHARSIAKADAARGYAIAADLFHNKLMKM